jgi:hypothetical protein
MQENLSAAQRRATYGISLDPFMTLCAYASSEFRLFARCCLCVSPLLSLHSLLDSQ